jgi:hypothetical protein
MSRVQKALLDSSACRNLYHTHSLTHARTHAELIDAQQTTLILTCSHGTVDVKRVKEGKRGSHRPISRSIGFGAARKN